MTDLRADLGRIQLKNPIICASSEFTMTPEGIRAALRAGAGAVIAKSVNEAQGAARQLDIAEYVLLDSGWAISSWDRAGLDASLFCRSGLAQMPLDQWLEMLARADAEARAYDAYVAGSITVAAPAPAARIAAAMEAAGLRWIELNLSAPHGRESVGGAVRQLNDADAVHEYVHQVRAAIKVPLTVKLTAQTADPLALAERAIAAGADMLVLMGRFQGFIPDIETMQPILGSAGAIGGPWALPLTLYWISKCFKALPAATPLVATNGVRTGDDVVRALLSGARAVEIASAVLSRGAAVIGEMHAGLEAYCARKKIARLGEIVGRAADGALGYGAVAPVKRSGYPWDRFIRDA
ncbi:MAG TPA: tRNA-dihydrouridine synthase [Candidatus Binataceae bacterium]|jgi:dihydroorotate dehydrogenase|nr:tRNA-dihydrouridine synthase [Candidatus Binataceae bacterium]